MKTSHSILVFMVALVVVCAVAASPLLGFQPAVNQGEAVSAPSGSSGSIQSEVVSGLQKVSGGSADDDNAQQPDTAKIDQHICIRQNNGFVDVGDTSTELYPAAGKVQLEDQSWLEGSGKTLKVYTSSLKNAVDRFVYVENKGNVDVFVRTWFAFEQGSYKGDLFDDLIKLNKNTDGWTYGGATVETIDGVRYAVFYADCTAAIAPYTKTMPSLMQLYVVSDAENSHMEQLDSNGNGYEIKIASQCVQAQDGLNSSNFGSTVFSKHPFNTNTGNN